MPVRRLTSGWTMAGGDLPAVHLPKAAGHPPAGIRYMKAIRNTP